MVSRSLIDRDWETVCVNCSDVTPYRALINTNVFKEDVSQEIVVFKGDKNK